MVRIKTVIVAAIVGVAVLGGWRAGMDEVANLELQQDMKDLVGQSHNYVRYTPPRTDDEYRAAVVRKAHEHDIPLTADEVKVTHQSSGTNSDPVLAADYSVPVHLPGYSFTLHFTPSSVGDTF